MQTRVAQKMRSIGLTILSGVTVIALLYLFSEKINKTANGFTRHFNKYQVNLLQFGKATSSPDVFERHIDSSFEYSYLGNKGLIIVDRAFRGGRTKDSLHVPAFTQCVSLSPQSFVLRGPNESSTDQIFLKLLKKGDHLYFTREQGLSETHKDAGISSDGVLNYEKRTHLLVYTQHYRNLVLCFDTTLHRTFLMHTIDTIASYRPFTISSFSGDREIITNDKPLRLVNLRSCTSDGQLYNQSALKADNEGEGDFDKKTVIDVYDLEKRQYTGSFYIPSLQGEKMKQFRILDQRIIVLYDHYLATYRLRRMI